MRLLDAKTACLALACMYAIGLHADAQSSQTSSQQPNRKADEVIELWPSSPPGKRHTRLMESNKTRAWDKHIAGRRIIKLGNVQTPQIHVFQPTEKLRNHCAVVICPGGGFNILAWDLEGLEIAEWLTDRGFTAFVVKYRVPTRHLEVPWQLPVQDAQRAMSIIRSQHERFSINATKIGMLGFSAGGKTVANASFTDQRIYSAVDKNDSVSFKPNFVALIYAAQLVSLRTGEVSPEIAVNKSSPPTFLVHTKDDHVSVRNAEGLHALLKSKNVPTQLNVYEKGGHGYGARVVDNLPVTKWPNKLENWLKTEGFAGK